VNQRFFKASRRPPLVVQVHVKVHDQVNVTYGHVYGRDDLAG